MRVALLGALLVAVALLAAPQPHADASVEFMKWTIDYDAKEIKVNAKLGFYADGGYDATRIAARAKAAIERTWNGHKFKCYAFEVEVEIDVYPSKSAVPSGSLPIYITGASTEAAGAIKSVQRGLGGEKPGDVLSDDPGVRLEPDSGDDSYYTVTASDGVFAHEFGHALGEQDKYEPGHGDTPKPGIDKDLMYNQNVYPTVNETTITRVVRRNSDRMSNWDEGKIQCPLSISGQASGVDVQLLAISQFGLSGYACDFDPPSLDPKRPPKAHFKGNVNIGGSALGAAGSVVIPVDFTFEKDNVEIPIVVNSPNGHTITLDAAFTWGSDGIPVQAHPLRLDGGGASEAYGLGIDVTITAAKNKPPACP